MFTPGALVVAVLCDRGERYLDTIFSDAWVMKHFGALPVISPKPRVLRERVPATAVADATSSTAGASALA